jgi:hypothetical protein
MPTFIACSAAAMVLGTIVGALLLFALIRQRLARPLSSETYQLINTALRMFETHLSAGMAAQGPPRTARAARARADAARQPAGVASSTDDFLRNIIDENLNLRA